MTRKTNPSQTTIDLDNATRAAIYTRVSTDEQVNGYGLEVQLTRCEAMATVKGWTVDRVYSDDGLSGTLDAARRPGLQALLQAACNGEIDAVIVLALDRLARKTTLVLDLVERLDGCGVQLVSVKEQLDTSTPSGRFVLTMFAALAQLERDTIVARTTDGRNQRGKVDGEKGGAVPFGYLRTRDTNGKATGVVVVDSEATIVRRIFALRQGGLALRKIADELNYNVGPELLAPRGGKAWYASTVKIILDNQPAYMGGLRGESAEQWPVILE